MNEAMSTIWHRLRFTRVRDLVRCRWDASLDWSHTIDQAELPTELANAVKQVVGRTRLWRREKVDVAMELVAHFQDGLEAGRTPNEMLQSFGDPVATAQLIRRAKRRGRSVMWKVIRYGSISALLILLVYIGIGFWMAAGRPTIKTDYLALLNRSATGVPEAERAWPIYRDALLEIGMNGDDEIPVIDAALNASDRSRPIDCKV
jgi:hypothetical protein